MALTGSGEPLKLTVARVSGNLFDVLGIQPLLGRTLRAADARRGSDLVVVLTHRLWRMRFGGDPGAIGRTIQLEGRPFEVVGVLAARMSLPAVLALLPRDTPRTGEIAMDWRVAVAAIGATAIAGLLFALAPALVSMRVRTAALLRAGAHSESRRSKRLRGSIATTEIALALVLTTGAGLMVRSLWSLQRIDPGFDADRVLTLHLQPVNVGGRTERPTAAYYAAILEKIRAVPGVASAGARALNQE